MQLRTTGCPPEVQEPRDQATGRVKQQMVQHRFRLVPGAGGKLGVGELEQRVHLAARGASQAIVATQAGTTQFCFVDLGSAAAAIEGKTLNVMGLTSSKRYELAPEIPTIAEQGLPGYWAGSSTLLLAPATACMNEAASAGGFTSPSRIVRNDIFLP